MFSFAKSPYDVFIWSFEVISGLLWLFVSINLYIGSVAFIQLTKRLILLSILIVIGLITVFASYILLLLVSGDDYSREIAIFMAFTFAVPVAIVLFIIIAPLVIAYIAADATEKQ